MGNLAKKEIRDHGFLFLHSAMKNPRLVGYGLARAVFICGKEWSGWSDRAIAREAGVDDKTVGKYRKQHVTAEIPQLNTPNEANRQKRKGLDGKERRVQLGSDPSCFSRSASISASALFISAMTSLASATAAMSLRSRS